MSYYIISATDRPESKTRQIAQILHGIYQNLGYKSEIIDLTVLPFHELISSPYSDNLPDEIHSIVSKLNKASALSIVCPEYNSSFPGILKYFIDHWSYPDTLYFRPISFVGLGGQFGGQMAVEQLQQIMCNQNAFIYPKKVLLRNVKNLLKDGTIQNKEIMNLLYKQVEGFLKFVKALKEKNIIPLPSC